MLGRIGRIAAVARRYVDMGAYASIEWLVMRDGREWLRGAAGMADPRSAAPLPEKPIYRLYSMTKPVVSAVALMLMEEGRLRLYDPVARFLPEFSATRIVGIDGGTRPSTRPILVEHLLTHRSGLSYGFLRDCPVAALYREAGLSADAGPLGAFVERIAALPVAFEPGTQWRYSVSTDVIGRIVEVIEGKPLQQVVRERVIDPLGLADTGYMVRESERARVLPMYGNARIDDLLDFPEGPQRLTPADVEGAYPAGDPGFARGGHGLFSTVGDYAAIAAFLATGRNGDGEILLSRSMVRLMWTNRTPESQMPLAIGPLPLPGYGYGLGGRVMADAKRRMVPVSEGEFGWSGAAGTFYWTDPAEKLTGLVMTQYLGSKHPLADDMRVAVYQALE